ncbi:MAG: phytanoyl-CoA dioxygenase family protein [Acidimicrobiia bacterium]
MRSLRRRRPVAPTTIDPPGTAARAEAAVLIRAGRRLEAIDVLTAANRDHRDDTIERDLVGLRNVAFDDLDKTPGSASWPPVAPDLFAGVDGIPEIGAAELTADRLRSGIVCHGALLVRGLVPPARVAHLIDDIDRTFVARDAFFDGAPVDDTAPWYVPFEPESGTAAIGPIRKWVREGGGVLTVESPRSMFDVLDTFEAVGLTEPLTGYLGERPVLAAKKWTLRRVPLDTTADWHQDGAFLGQGVRAVNVWVALSHCGDTAPGLDIVAGRLHELAPRGTDGAWFDWSVGDAVARALAGDAAILRPIFEAGDAILFDDMNLHRTAVTSEMTDERYAIESWFFAPSHYPDAQIPVTF